MIELTDTHCHIQSISLDVGERTTRQIWAKTDLTADKVVAEAAGQGVNRLICVGCDLEDSCLAVDFVQDRPNCWASIGIHPHEAQHYQSGGRKLPEFAALATRPKVVAIGECGLDYYYKHSPKADQIKVLEFQLELAQAAGLPLIFHVREAFDDFWPILDNYKGVKGVLHSFTDSAANMAEGLKRGLHIGVNGIATFTRDPAQTEAYRAVPLEKLLLETDSPFLTPAPYRGNVNSPKHIGAIAGFLAELRGENLEDLAKTTTANAIRLFGLRDTDG
jgi:TatD DNase family protein